MKRCRKCGSFNITKRSHDRPSKKAVTYWFREWWACLRGHQDG